MGQHETSVQSVNLREAHLLAAVRTTSSTCSYVDNRSEIPWLLRARGEGNTGHAPSDDGWVPLAKVVSGPRTLDANGLDLEPDRIDPVDVVPWMLRVGSRHLYRFIARDNGLLDEGIWIQRVAPDVALLEERPPEGQRIRTADEVDFSDRAGPRARGDDQ